MAATGPQQQQHPAEKGTAYQQTLIGCVSSAHSTFPEGRDATRSPLGCCMCRLHEQAGSGAIGRSYQPLAS